MSEASESADARVRQTRARTMGWRPSDTATSTHTEFLFLLSLGYNNNVSVKPIESRALT